MNLLAAVVLTSGLWHQAPADPRHITVDVRVVDASGTPVARVPLMAKVDSTNAFAETDADGTANFNLLAPATDVKVDIATLVGPARRGEKYSEYRERKAAGAALIEAHTFEKAYATSVPQGSERGSLRIVVQPALKVTFKVEDAGTPVQHGGVVGRQLPLTVQAKRPVNGSWTIGCIRPNERTVLFALCGNSAAVPIVTPPIQKDTNLGVFQVPTWKESAQVPITLTNFTGKGLAETRLRGISFVKSDGSLVQSFLDLVPGDAIEVTGDGKSPSLPEGTFYVVPGAFMATRAQVRLFERCAAGEDLCKSSIPKVVVSGGKADHITVDTPAAEAAILSETSPK
ncbi:MAG TPA: hypothetical protein VD997_09855 [Phycisphaerales bacterium]|nr:hypothetical protein [Phycisphaerales bacterium]